jgi:protein ImuB
MRRILCVWLPDWPVTRARLERGFVTPDRPFALIETVKEARIVTALNEAAAAKGVRVKQKLADAKAVVPDLQNLADDPQGDEAALTKLMGFTQCFSPLTAVNSPDGLWLDITGCAHLFGGEESLAATLLAALKRRGIPARAGVAGTFGAAWAFSRQTNDVLIAPPGAHRTMLPDMPLSCLRLPPDTLASLGRLGLRTVRQVMALPRSGVAKRFAIVLTRLDQALGDATEAIDFYSPAIHFAENVAFAEPISTPEDLTRALAKGLEILCARLARAGQGGRHFFARFHRADGDLQTISIATALPCRDAARLLKLLAAKLEQIDPGFGIEALTVSARQAEPLGETQLETGNEKGSHETSLAALIDSLANRLGHDRIWRAAPNQSYLPEKAVKRVSPLAPVLSDDWRKSSLWPVRLFAHPEPIDVIAPVPDHPPITFRWRKVVRRVRRAEGPERIEPEWWQDGPRADEKARDYYRVEDQTGARFWIYRSGQYSEAKPPSWFLHGLFA